MFRIIILISIIVMFHGSIAYGQNNQTGQDEKIDKTMLMVEGTNNFSIIQLYIGGLAVVLPLVATIGVYWHQQRKNKLELIHHSRDSIQNELQSNKKELEVNEDTISYVIDHNNKELKIEFTNSYLDTTAFDGIVGAGFVYFNVALQYEITMLYGRIKKHNELLTYIDHFEDLFFLNGKNSERKKQWGKAVLRYHESLTSLDSEIQERIKIVEKALPG